MNRGFANIGLVITLIAVVLIGGGGYWVLSQKPSASPAAGVPILPNNTTVRTQPTTVPPASPASPTLTASPTSGAAPLTVTFQFKNLEENGSYYLDTGDEKGTQFWIKNGMVCVSGASASSCMQEITHAFVARSGPYEGNTFKIRLFKYDETKKAYATEVAIGNITISVTGSDTQMIRVSGNSNTQAVDFRLFSLSSSNFAIFGAPLANGDSATNYEIEFGDGEKATMIPNGSSCPASIGTNCSPSPITSMYNAHQYVKQGTFIARLKNLTMSCTSQDCNVVGAVTVVIGSPKPPPSSSVY